MFFSPSCMLPRVFVASFFSFIVAKIIQYRHPVGQRFWVFLLIFYANDAFYHLCESPFWGQEHVSAVKKLELRVWSWLLHLSCLLPLGFHGRMGKQQMISHLQMRRAVGLGLIPTAIMECNAVCHLEKLKAYIPGDLVSLSYYVLFTGIIELFHMFTWSLLKYSHFLHLFRFYSCQVC